MKKGQDPGPQPDHTADETIGEPGVGMPGVGEPGVGEHDVGVATARGVPNYGEVLDHILDSMSEMARAIEHCSATVPMLGGMTALVERLHAGIAAARRAKAEVEQ